MLGAWSWWSSGPGLQSSAENNFFLNKMRKVSDKAKRVIFLLLRSNKYLYKKNFKNQSAKFRTIFFS